MRTKLGTVLNEKIVRELKARADKEDRTMSDVIEEALEGYFHAPHREAAVRLAAVERLCARPFKLSRKELAEIVDEDPYAQ